jgi:hypothetical protein
LTRRIDDLENENAELTCRIAEENAELRKKNPTQRLDQSYSMMCDCELFTLVLYPEAGATNNEAGRSLRDAAQDRRTGRTSKALRGAQRRTILVSVLESLNLHLPEFTLSSVHPEL